MMRNTNYDQSSRGLFEMKLKSVSEAPFVGSAQNYV